MKNNYNIFHVIRIYSDKSDASIGIYKKLYNNFIYNAN